MPQDDPVSGFARRAGAETGEPDVLPRYADSAVGKGPYISNGKVVYAFRQPREMMTQHGPLLARNQKYGVNFLQDPETGIMIGVLTEDAIAGLNGRIEEHHSGDVTLLDALQARSYQRQDHNSNFHAIYEPLPGELAGEQPPLITRSPYVSMPSTVEPQRYGIMIIAPEGLMKNEPRTVKTDLYGHKKSSTLEFKLMGGKTAEQQFWRDAATAFRAGQQDTSAISTLEITYDVLTLPAVLMRYDGGVPVSSQFMANHCVVAELYSGMGKSGDELVQLITKIQFVEPKSSTLLPLPAGENALEGVLQYQAMNRSDSVTTQFFNPWTGLVEVVVDMGTIYVNPRVVGTTEQIEAPDISGYLTSGYKDPLRSSSDVLMGMPTRSMGMKSSSLTPSRQNVGRTVVTNVRPVNVETSGIDIQRRASVFSVMLTNPEL